MKTIFKYQGGKGRELEYINSLLPEDFEKIETVVEPFVGGGAFFLHYEKNSIINDIDENVIHFYETYFNNYDKMCDIVEYVKSNYNLEKFYYNCRDKLNKNSYENNIDKALTFYVTRQLCYRGMFRYNSKGEFNVPFGHYKTLKSLIKISNFPIKTFNVSFEQINIPKNSFIFLDPPYIDSLPYKEGNNIDLHEKLLKWLTSLQDVKWLLVHSLHPFYVNNYMKYNIRSCLKKYSMNFLKDKGSKIFKETDHLYISNY